MHFASAATTTARARALVLLLLLSLAAAPHPRRPRRSPPLDATAHGDSGGLAVGLEAGAPLAPEARRLDASSASGRAGGAAPVPAPAPARVSRVVRWRHDPSWFASRVAADEARTATTDGGRARGGGDRAPPSGNTTSSAAFAASSSAGSGVVATAAASPTEALEDIAAAAGPEGCCPAARVVYGEKYDTSTFSCCFLPPVKCKHGVT